MLIKRLTKADGEWLKFRPWIKTKMRRDVSSASENDIVRMAILHLADEWIRVVEAAEQDSPYMASKDPLHGIKLETILIHLVETYGWERMANEVRINCFIKDPSIKSSLTFLRKNQWARAKVEHMYLESIGHSKDPFEKQFIPLSLE